MNSGTRSERTGKEKLSDNELGFWIESSFRILGREATVHDIMQTLKRQSDVNGTYRKKDVNRVLYKLAEGGKIKRMDTDECVGSDSRTSSAPIWYHCTFTPMHMNANPLVNIASIRTNVEEMQRHLDAFYAHMRQELQQILNRIDQTKLEYNGRVKENGSNSMHINLK